MMFLCALLSAQTVSVTFSGRLAENEEYLPHPVPLHMFGAASYNAFFWTSTENGPNWAYNRYLVFSGSGVYRLENDCVKSYGWAVRCIRD